MSEFLVKMDTPNRCCDCPMCYDYILCRLAGKEFGEIECVEIVADWCPLIKIPPHGRLIDADALHKLFEDQWHYLQVLDWNENPTAEARQSGVNWCINTMHDSAPTIIEAEEGE